MPTLETLGYQLGELGNRHAEALEALCQRAGVDTITGASVKERPARTPRAKKEAA